MDGSVATPVPTMAELAERIAGRMRDYVDNPQHPDLIGHPEGNPVQIRPAFPNADVFTRRLIEGVQANAGRYAEGVRNPRDNFLDAAKRANGAWKAGVQAAVAGDRFIGGLNKVNADEAIEIAATVGAQSYVGGVTGREAKIRRVMGEVAPMMAAATATTRALPSDTDAQREARAIAQIRGARAVGIARRGGK